MQHLSPTKTLIIATEKSEELLCSNVSQKLRLPVLVHRLEKGAINTTELVKFFQTGEAKAENSLLKKFPQITNISHTPSFRIYPILYFPLDCLDLDFVSGSLFSGHSLRKYIFPIYCVPNLDNIMMNAGYHIEPRKLTGSYQDIFPGPTNDIERLRELLEKVKRTSTSSETNIETLLEHLVSLAA